MVNDWSHLAFPRINIGIFRRSIRGILAVGACACLLACVAVFSFSQNDNMNFELVSTDKGGDGLTKYVSSAERELHELEVRVRD